jgi:hypothetical protein
MTSSCRANRGFVVAVLALFLAAADVSQAGNWSGWRGPTGIGYCDEKDLPLHWGRQDQGESALEGAGGTGWSFLVLHREKVRRIVQLKLWRRLDAEGKDHGSRRKSLPCLVPKTGIEPALPLREPGPEPGASANSATSAQSSSS